jgi:hypothetical protein
MTIRRKSIQLLLCGGIAVLLSGQSAMAESLYEFYMNTPRETLQTETRQMSQDLKMKFTERGIVAKRQEILFSGYLSNLEKAVSYAAKIAPYSQYEEDLEYARDHELFKTLSGGEETRQQQTEAEAAQELRDRKKYAGKKVDQMEKNVTEDIDIYSSMIKVALDDCEDVFYSDLDSKDFFSNDNFSDRINDFFASDTFALYLERQKDFASRWPGMETRLRRQIELWGKAPVDGGQTILDPAIIQAL